MCESDSHLAGFLLEFLKENLLKKSSYTSPSYFYLSIKKSRFHVMHDSRYQFGDATE